MVGPVYLWVNVQGDTVQHLPKYIPEALLRCCYYIPVVSSGTLRWSVIMSAYKVNTNYQTRLSVT